MKKTLQFCGISALVLVISAVASFGLLQLIRQKNVEETGNVLGVTWYKETEKEFTISTAEELMEFAELSNFYSFSGQTIKLGADIVLNEGNAEDWKEQAPAKRWKTISEFAGTFDGQGHSISGLYGRAYEVPMALFTKPSKESVIQNVRLLNSYFETRGRAGVASFVSKGGGTLKQLYSDAIINHNGANAAGIASALSESSELEECWFDGVIRTTLKNCGGIIDGVNVSQVSVKHSLFSGEIYSQKSDVSGRVGGICGYVEADKRLVLVDCLSAGKIACEDTKLTGAIVGRREYSSYVSMQDVFASKGTYKFNFGSDGERGTLNGNPIQLRESELVGEKAYQWTSLDFDKYWLSIEQDTPSLKHFTKEGLDLSGVKKAYDVEWYNPSQFVFELTNLEQLYGMSYVSATTNFEGKRITLGADIVVNEGTMKDLKSEEVGNLWIPICDFAGTFDGKGHTISGIYVDTYLQYQGLFKTVQPTAVVRDFRLTNSYFCNRNETLAMMGSIAGEFRGKLDSVYSDAYIISYGPQAGGLVARSNDNDDNGAKDAVIITNCWFDGEVHIKGETNTYGGGIVAALIQGDLEMTHCLNTGLITSEATKRGIHIGGLLGSMSHAKAQLVMDDCLNAGNLKVAYSVSVGSAIGRVGTPENHTATITNSYTTTESYEKAIGTSGGIIHGGVIQLSKSMLSDLSAYRFTELDFKTYWAVVKDDTPVLSKYAGTVPSVAGVEKAIDMNWYQADKTEYVIRNLKELYGFACMASATDFKGKTVKLANDISVNAVDKALLSAWKDGTKVATNPWICIGSSNKPFEGNFDGQGHRISGIYLKTEQQYTGMFGFVNPNGTVKNIRLEDSYFCNTNEKLAMMGSVAGETRGTIENVYSNAIVVAYGPQVGGIAARSNDNDDDGVKDTAIIHSCWFDGEVHLKGKSNTYVAGIVAAVVQGDLEVAHCLNTGTITSEATKTGLHVSGLVGSVSHVNARLVLKDSLNTGKVEAQYDVGVGSVLGRVSSSKHFATIGDTYTTVESHPFTIGTSGGVIDGGAIQLTEDILQGYDAYRFTNLDFKNYWSVRENGTPVLRVFADANPSLAGIEKMVDTSWYKEDAKVMIIRNLKELYGFASLSSVTNFKGQTIKLANDIQVDANPWICIGSEGKGFEGTFDGQGKTIAGIHLETDRQYVGIFGYVSPNGTVKNFSIKDSYFCNTNEKGAYMGSAVGELRGTLENVYSNATVISYGPQAGGLVGRSNDNDSDGVKDTVVIRNCWFDGKAQLKGDSNTYVAGIVAAVIQGDLEISNCLNTGIVSSEKTTNGACQVGGLVGSVSHGEAHLVLKNSLNAGKIDAKATLGVGSVIGRVASEKQKATISNTYTSSESYNAAIGYSTGVIKGNVTTFAESWYQGTNAYRFTQLDFDKYWAARDGKVAALKTFVDASEWMSLAGIIVPDMSWYSENAEELFIENKEQFYGFTVLAATNDFSNQIVRLKADIRLNSVSEEEFEKWVSGERVPENTWAPVGSLAVPFRGTFDGQGHTISGLYVSGGDYQGLFGYVDKTGKVGNFKVIDTYIESNGFYVGTIGYLYGSCQSIYSEAVIRAKAGSAYVGGISGRVRGQCANYSQALYDANAPQQYFKNCWFDGTITLPDSVNFVGGITSELFGNGVFNFENCLVTGTITGTKATEVGGIYAYDQSSMQINLKNCLFTGQIQVPQATNLGYLMSGIKSYTKVNISNAFTTGSDAYAYNSSSFTKTLVETDYIKARMNLLLKTEAEVLTVFPKLDGESESAWTCDVVRNSVDRGTPLLKKYAAWWIERQPETEVMIDPDTSWYDENKDTFLLKNVEEFIGFAQLALTKDFAGKTVKLDADIQLNKVEADTIAAWQSGEKLPENIWTPVGTYGKTFKGTFDGQGHTISGIYVKGKEYQGLFGYVDKTGVVRNFKLLDSYIESTGNYVGTIAYLHGNCESIYSNVVINAKAGSGYVGGIVGRFRGQCSSYSQALYEDSAPKQYLKDCQFDGKILLAAGVNYAGGLTSELFGNGVFNIENCRMTGTITGTTATEVGGLYAYDQSSMQINLKDCLVTGVLNVPQASKLGYLMAGIKSYTKVNISNTYTTNAPAFSYNSSSFTKNLVASDYVKSKEALSVTKVAQKLSSGKTISVPMDMLNVKVQIAQNGSKYMRFVSSVDSLEYKAVGFEVTPQGGTPKVYNTNIVFEKVRATTAGMDYEFSPKVVSHSSEYFMTAKIKADENVNYTVRAFVIPLNGTDADKIYGEARVIGLQDGEANILNLRIDGNLMGDNLTATVTNYTSAVGTDIVAEAPVEVLSTGDNYSNIRVNLGTGVKVEDLTSASKVTVGSSSGIYRNYGTSHVATTGTEAVADVSWYYVNPSASKFTIASSADMFGLAKLVNTNVDLFTSDTITMVKNVEINKGTAKRGKVAGTTPSWQANEGASTYSWTPIGSSATVAFDGTFDGDGNEISGIYMNGTAAGSGLFGYVGSNCSIRDFAFINSYLNSQYGTVGMIGSGSPKCIEDVYADIIVTYKNGNAGGFIGKLQGQGQNTTPAQVINNCWFDGEIYHVGGSFYSAFIGIVETSANLKITNCLVTGDIVNATGNWCSAFIGYMGVACKLDMQNCLALGDVPSGFRHGSISSRIDFADGAIKNVYTTVAESQSPLYGYGSPKVTQTNVAVKNRNDLLLKNQTAVETLLPKLEGEEVSPWVYDTATNSAKRGTPILRTFASWWKERYVYVPDTSWYKDSGTEFEIHTVEEFYGFAELAKTKTFAGQTITLCADITLNEADVYRVAAWEEGNDLPVNVWTPIGKEAAPFAGTFDGKGHIISGLYAKGTSYVGLFGYVGKAGVVKDFRLEDGYIESTGSYVGSIAYLYGSCESIYSNVVINAKAGSGYVGGITGRFRGQCTSYSQALYEASAPQQYLKNCWFDGKILLASGINFAGGIAGELFGNGVFNLENCLMTGSISGTTVTEVGGIYSYDQSSSQINLKNCLMAGTLNVTQAGKLGYLMAGIKSYTKVNISNAYTTTGPAFSYNSSSFTKSLVAADYLKGASGLSASSFPKLSGESESAWVNSETYGIPVLKYFVQ